MLAAEHGMWGGGLGIEGAGGVVSAVAFVGGALADLVGGAGGANSGEDFIAQGLGLGELVLFVVLGAG